MKKFLLLTLVMVVGLGVTGMGQALASFTIDFDDHVATDNRDSIDGLYDDYGIYFKPDTTDLTDPVVYYYDCTVLPAGSNNNVFWYPLDEDDSG